MNNVFDEEYKLVYNRPDRTYLNKKASIDKLEMVQKAMIKLMVEYGVDYCPPELKKLSETAGLPLKTFKNNFTDFNSVLYWSKFYLIKNTKARVKEKAVRGEISSCLYWYFKAIGEHPVQAEFAIRRFGPEFWCEVLRPIETLITSDWALCTVFAGNFLFEDFAAQFRELLKLWLVEEFDTEKILNYVALAKTIPESTSKNLLRYLHSNSFSP